MSLLKCGQCGHDNDLTRVFCQNCGARLERAEGSAPTIAAPTQVPTERPATTKKKKEARARGIKNLIGALISIVVTVVIAVGLALVIEMARQPDGIPVAKAGNEAKAVQLYQSLKSFSNSSFPRAIDVNQDQANNYLASRLVPGASEADSTSSMKAKFVRAFVVISEGKLRFYVEEQFLGQPFFMYSEYEPQQVDKLVTLHETGGGIGHVRFNESFLPILDRLVGPVSNSALDVSDIVQGLNGLDLKPAEGTKPAAATLRWSGSSKSSGE